MTKLSIFKIGGKVIDNPQILARFLEGFAALPEPKILVHGGGLIADEMASRLGVETEMRGGRRITSAPMRDIVSMVYGGLINNKLVADLQALDCDAVGFSGADAGLITAVKRTPLPVDYGFVGDITAINSDRLEAFLSLGLVPVFAPLTSDGEILNTNADSIARALAVALAPTFRVQLFFCFEQPGVMLDLSDDASLIKTLTSSHYETLVAKGVITLGMLPKLEACFEALRNGVETIVLAYPLACLAAAGGQRFLGTSIAL